MTKKWRISLNGSLQITDTHALDILKCQRARRVARRIVPPRGCVAAAVAVRAAEMENTPQGVHQLLYKAPII